MHYPRIAPVPLQYCTYIQFFEQENKENKENKKGKPIMATEIYTMSNPNMMAAMGRLDSADLAERLGLDKNVDKTTFLNELHTRFDAGLIDDQPTLKLMATLIDRGLMMDYVNGQIVKVEWPEPEPKTDPFEQSDAIAASILSLIDGNAHPEPDDDSDDTDDTDDDDYYNDEDDDDDDDGNEYSPSYLDDRHDTDNDVTNTGDTDNTDDTDSAASTTSTTSNNETPSETKANGVSNIRVHIHADNDAELDAKLKAVLDLIDNMMASR